MTEQKTITLSKQQLENHLRAVEFAADQLGQLSQVAHCIARSDADPVDIEGALRSLPFTMAHQINELRRTREQILEAMESNQPSSVAVAVDPSGTRPANSADRIEHALCCLRSLRRELADHPPEPDDFESIDMAIADLESINTRTRR
ncbi:MAG: hypothetical protein V2J19_04095 [Wenzhouxiangella sp.]|jgi:hypothetical protein|nr:hypothetical protein [Wenzhouxiangella sp.]